jgi:hypothetical protein
VACGGKKRHAYRILNGKLQGKKDNLEDLSVYGRIILKWTFRNMIGKGAFS